MGYLILIMVLGAALSAVALSKHKVAPGITGAVLLAGSSLGLYLMGATPWVFIAWLAGFIALPWATNPNKQGAPRGRIISSLAITAIAAVIATPAAVASVGAHPSSGDTQVVADAQQDLTVHADGLIPKEAQCATDEFNDNSRKPVGTGTDHRLWVDSDSTPFAATEKGALYDELVRDICGNPTLGLAYADALDTQIGGFSVKSGNPWLSDFLQKSNGENGMRTWLTYKEGHGKTIYVTGTSEGEYQYYAELVATLLYALDNQGVKTAPSTANWPLGAMIAGDLPRAHKVTDKDAQEDKPFVAFTFTRKSGDTCPYVLGANMMDKRPENVSCETATQVAPSTPTKPRPGVTPPTGTSTPTPSTTPSTPGHTPTPTPSTCPPGQTGTPPNCLEVKNPTPIPTNPNHTPVGSPSGPAGPPVHPSVPANPSTQPGAGSTQTAPGASSAPKPTESVPPAGDPSSTATACIPNPDTGKGC